ncbi:MAG: hypothetical protein R3F61_35895 [Myxococcota bacterium]
MILLALQAALADCTAVEGTSALALMDSALLHYENIEIDAFLADAALTRTALECHTVPVSRAQAARLHRMFGMVAFLEHDSEAAQAWFLAARSIEPAYVFPETLVPRGNPLLQDYEARSVAELTPVPLPSIPDGRLQADGSATTWTPGIPAIVQQFDDSGAVAVTRILGPGDPMPWQAVTEVRERRPARLTVGVGALIYGRTDSPPVQAAYGVSAAIPVGPVDLDLGVQLGATRQEVPDKSGELRVQTVSLPLARVGVRVPFGTGPVVPHLGAAVVGTVNHDGLGVGGAGLLGARIPLSGPLELSIDGLAGWERGFVGTAVAGIALAL